MRRNNCGVVRRELDELMLDESCRSDVLAHLEECSECREFKEQQTKLRQIVGSLGTVAAPADFDFRLRARLANESNGAAFHLSSLSSLFARRGFAVSATLLLFLAIGVVVVRNVMNRPERTEVAETNPPRVDPAPPENPVPATSPREEVVQRNVVATVDQSHLPKVKPGRPMQAVLKPKRNMVAEDFSSQRPDVFGGTPRIGSTEVFPIDASLESFKVSLDDGRGNARTISLPTIRFGSQRMLPSGNQYAAKGVW